MNVGMPEARMVSMAELVKRRERFLIPLYQRLFVWKPEQVERLMDDIVAAWQQDKPVYYLGGILAIRRGGVSSEVEELELIDGQQRLTTLWLLAVAWRDDADGDSLADFVCVDGEPRLRFAIREKVNDFIHAAQAGKPEGSAETAAMENALAVLKAIPDSRPESHGRMPSRAELAGFIRDRAKLALTEVPANTDLNKLFEVINNRGEQLQHHDILKQRLLNCIDATEREAYARLWDACAAMDGYVERNLVKAQGQTLKDAFEEWFRFSEPASLGETRELIACLQGEGEDAGSPLSLSDVLKADIPVENKARRRRSDADDAVNEPVIRSILPFPLLLQHALRIFRHRKNESDLEHIHDKDLLEIFGKYFFSVPEWNESGTASKAFIQLLWEVRVAFDTYVVKWVEWDEGERRLDVRRISADESFVRTTNGVPRGLSLLQAVIYHSQGKTSQYWLTPFLDYALGNPDWDEALVYLEYLDHFLFTRPSEKNLRELSHEMLTDNVPEPVPPELPAALDEKNGTGFRHYWSYKTEYVLWQALEKDKSLPSGWRIVARNSVEHIAPQQAIGGKNEVGEWLHAFANLALVSREANSRYGNDIFEQKKKKYEQSEENTRSLKLGLVFSHTEWTVDTIEAHKQEIPGYSKAYLERLSEQVDSKLINHS